VTNSRFFGEIGLYSAETLVDTEFCGTAFSLDSEWNRVGFGMLSPNFPFGSPESGEPSRRNRGYKADASAGITGRALTCKDVFLN